MLFLRLKQYLTKLFYMKYRLTAGLTLPLLLVSCAQAPKTAVVETPAANQAPEWVMTPPEDNLVYLYTIGESQVINGDHLKAEQDALNNAQSKLQAKLRLQLNQSPSSKIFLDELVPGDLENQLRARIQNKINYAFFEGGELESVYLDANKQQVYTLMKASREKIEKSQLTALKKLDAQLRDYENASQKGSKLVQLLSLLPALPTLEAHENLYNTLAASHTNNSDLPSQQMASLMDRQITRLFDGLVITVDSITAETAKLEPQLTKALRDEGFYVSARRPDLALRYYIEMDRQNENNQFQVTLTNDIEFINRDSTTFATFNQSILERGQTLIEAESKAMATLAASVKNLILQKMEERITTVNQLKFGR